MARELVDEMDDAPHLRPWFPLPFNLQAGAGKAEKNERYERVEGGAGKAPGTAAGKPQVGDSGRRAGSTDMNDSRRRAAPAGGEIVHIVRFPPLWPGPAAEKVAAGRMPPRDGAKDPASMATSMSAGFRPGTRR